MIVFLIYSRSIFLCFDLFYKYLKYYIKVDSRIVRKNNIL